MGNRPKKRNTALSQGKAARMAAATPDLDTLQWADRLGAERDQLDAEIQAGKRKQTHLDAAVSETLETKYPHFRQIHEQQAALTDNTRQKLFPAYDAPGPSLALTDEQDRKRGIVEHLLAEDVRGADDAFKGELHRYDWHNGSGLKNESRLQAATMNYVERIAGFQRHTFSTLIELAEDATAKRGDAVLWARDRIQSVLAASCDPHEVLDTIAIVPDWLPDGVSPRDAMEHATEIARTILASLNRLVEEELLMAMSESPRAAEETSLNHSEEQAPPATVEPGSADVELGRWADNRLREFKQFASLVRSGSPPEALRSQFLLLFVEVIDKLPELKRNRLVEACQRKSMTVPDLMEYIAEVKELKGSTLLDHRKKYRHESGTGRKRHRSNW